MRGHVASTGHPFRKRLLPFLCGEEEWRPVVDWEGVYEVSSVGRIKRVSPWYKGRQQEPFELIRKLRWVKRHLPSGGYHRIALVDRKTGHPKEKFFLVHTLVCRAFHGPKPTDKHLVAHNDGNGTNNRADNLRWATSKENGADTKKHGNSCKGDKNRTTLTNQDVLYMRELCTLGYLKKEIGKAWGVQQVVVHRIQQRRTWAHI